MTSGDRGWRYGQEDAGGVWVEQKPSVQFTLDGLVNIRRRWKATLDLAVARYTKIRGGMADFPESGDLAKFSFLNFGGSGTGNLWNGTQARCIESSIEPIDREAGFYMLNESYVGYFSDRLPQTTFRWTPNRLDVPIDQHPRWNEGKLGSGAGWVNDAAGMFVYNKHWTKDPATGTATIPFPAWELYQGADSGTVNSNEPNAPFQLVYNDGGHYSVPGSGSGDEGGHSIVTDVKLNPYRGIEAFPMATGTWVKVSFYPAILGDEAAPALLSYGSGVSNGSGMILDCAPLWKWSNPDTEFAAGNGSGRIDNWVLENGDVTNNDLYSCGIPAYQNNSFTYPDDPDSPPHKFKNWIKTQDDLELVWRGAVPLWQRTESWWFNARGWIGDIYNPFPGEDGHE